ncbi:MAG: hypothetical protein KBT19_09410 [Lachnospiraceae bacterium]|nr:hypothetical protein [Candidatus Colinaster equi]
MSTETKEIKKTTKTTGEIYIMELVRLFDDADVLVKRLKKAIYEQNMEVFKERFAAEIDVFANCVEDEADTSALDTLADSFVNEVKDKFAKNGKIGKTKMLDLNFMMIYYIFPAIMMAQPTHSALICDTIRDKWNDGFGTKIDYASYDTIIEGFKGKFLGIFGF